MKPRPHSRTRAATGQSLVFLAFLSATLEAQTLSPRFEQLSIEQGLSFNQVNSILQDSRGFMWFGTMNGFNKYDGYKFTVYTVVPGDTTSIPVRLANTLYEDSNGDIWVNGVGQLARYERATDRFVRYTRSTSVTSMIEERLSEGDSTSMWFATNGGGLHCYNEVTRSFSYYAHDPRDSNTVSSDSLTCLLVDRTGTLWIGGIHGLSSLDKSRRRFTHYAKGPSRPIWALYEEPATTTGLLWVGAEDGLYSYNRSQKSFSHYRNDLGGQANDVRNIYCDRKERLWVGTMSCMTGFDRSTGRFTNYTDLTRGSFWQDHRTWTFHEDRTGTLYVCGNGTPLRKFDERAGRWIEVLSKDRASFITIYEDRTGTLWFGTWVDGVLKLDPSQKPFIMYKHVNGDPASLSSSLVTGISQDRSGYIWVGSHAGLNKLNPTTDKFTHYEKGISNDVIWPVLEDGHRYLWVGTLGGLDRLDRVRNSFKHYLSGQAVTSLRTDHNGTLWAGIAGGILAKYDRFADTFQKYSPPYAEGFGFWEVQAIMEDHGGLIWMAVIGQGLISYNPSTGKWGKQYVWNPHSANWQNELNTFGLHALCLDRHGTLWIGTAAGLYKFNTSSETFTGYARDEKVSGIQEDDSGNLWISTMRGVSKFDPRTETFRRYDKSDGVNIGSWSGPTGYRGQTGEMFFGGSSGLLRFHPDSIRDNPYVPPVVITAFSKFNQPVHLDSTISEKKSLELSYKDNMITFEFAALNYTSPGKNQYAYRMIGFDTGWVYSGTERKATYTNLDGGSYIFRVKGSNNDGIWNEEGTSIAVIITPPFWATWWFRGFAFIFVLISVGGTIRYVEKRKLMRRIEQLEQERALERERARISQDMHDEVGASLSEIAILSELAKKKPHEADVHVQEISERAAEVIDNVSEIVWAINPKNDTLDNLVAHLRRYAVKYLGLAQIRCTFNAPDVIPAHHLTAEVRRNLFLVVKEALHNVVKHSGATEVYIDATLRDDSLDITISDKGRGFDLTDNLQAGNGLVGMHKRIADIGGVLRMESELRKGTKIEVHLPNSTY